MLCIKIIIDPSDNSLLIQNVDYERRFPNGRKTTLFMKTQVQHYAPYVQMDGLVEKLTIYDDYKYKLPLRVYDNYRNRGDKLMQSIKYLDTGLVIDSYKRGRPDALKGQ